MDRITYKQDNGYYNIKSEYQSDIWGTGIKMVQLLGAIEDISEELRCPLDVVFKAIKNGIYNGCNEHFSCSLWFNNSYGYMFAVDGGNYPLSEYRKTWWLKEDKSE